MIMPTFASLFIFLLHTLLVAASPANHTRSCESVVSPDEVRVIQGKLAIDMKTFPTNATYIDSKLADPIQIYWHVIRSGNLVTQGNIPTASIREAVRALNRHWSGSGFTFVLQQIIRNTNANWFFNARRESAAELSMKTALYRGDRRTLNVYSVGVEGNFLGYARFPWDYDSSPRRDGVVILHSSVPGGAATNYNEGKTLTHEVGHWLGLLHVFDGESCSGPGDLVGDTPIQSTPSYGCEWGKDSCPGGERDSIHNYMDYSYDWCMSYFTPGQLAWARWVASAWRGIS